MLDGEIKTGDSKKKKKSNKIKNPVSKLSTALNHYKTERIKTETDLKNTIDKVNLDKSILFREKQKVLWGNTTEETQSVMDMSLRK